MKRIFALLLAAALLLSLSGCAKAAGGSYKLEYVTVDGLRYPPNSLNMNFSFTLEEDGVGTASYGGSLLDITWTDEGSTVVIVGPNGTIELDKDGSSLILHDEGAFLYFKPQED